VPKKLILIVIDGLTPAAFEGAAEDDRMPALKFLAANGIYARGVSTFPSLTPVCLSSIVMAGSWACSRRRTCFARASSTISGRCYPGLRCAT